MTTAWLLAIDFGTTYTAAAVHSDGQTRMVVLSPDGAFRMPSAVWLDATGAILVGSAAAEQAPLAPDRFERTPKRCLDQDTILLGPTRLDPTVLVSHLLGHVVEEAARLFNNTRPTAVVLTHPAAWAARRTARLAQAAQAAGLEEVSLLAEPVAAAVHLGASVPVGEQVAVFDFGGGTLDVAVLRRTVTGFDISGPPGGIDPLGGEDIDQHILDFLGRSPISAHPDWPKLLQPLDTGWRMRKSALRKDIRAAKEALSSLQSYQLFISGLDHQVQLTRGELTDLIRRDVDCAVDVLVSAIQAAGQSPEDLARIFLVGGTSRIPLVAEILWQRLGRRPDTRDDPKSVVAQGAVTWLDQQTTTAPPPPMPPQHRAIPLRPTSETPPQRNRTRVAVLTAVPILTLIALTAVVVLVNRPELPPPPTSLAPVAGQHAYVATAGAGTVSMIDTETNMVVGKPTKVGDNPRWVALAPDGGRAYVANTDSDTVSVIDTTTNTQVGNPITVGDLPEGLAVSPDGRRVYVANSNSDSVSVIDATTNTIVGNPVKVGDGPVGVAVSPDGHRAYVVSTNAGIVSVIDTATNTVVGNPIKVGYIPHLVAVSPDGRRAYVTIWSASTVSVIDMRTNTVVGNPIPVGDKPFSVAVTPDGRRVYVANAGANTVSVIDTETNTVMGTAIPVGSNPLGMAIAPDGRHVYVANTNSDTVSVIDTATNTVVGSPIPVGDKPVGMAITPGR